MHADVKHLEAGNGYDRTAKVLVWLLLIVTVGCWAGHDRRNLRDLPARGAIAAGTW